LQVSLIETRWAAGKVRSEHVAGLGSIHVGQARLSASTPSMSAKPLKADIRELVGKVGEVPQAVVRFAFVSATSPAIPPYQPVDEVERG